MNFFYKLKWLYSDFIYYLKGRYSYLTKGFNYQDTFSLDISLAKWVVPRLKYFRKNLHSHPNELTFKEWKTIIDKMIWSFEYVLKEDDYIEKCYPKNYDFGFDTDENGVMIWKDKRKPNFNKLKPYEKRFDVGILLFARYYKHLWD